MTENICRNYSKVAWSITGPKEAVFTRLRCKQWSCPYCAQQNAKMWRGFLSSKLPEISQNWAFVTLTAPPHKRSEAASLAAIRDNLDRLMKRVKRVYGDDLEYVRVYEAHKSGAIHAHMIISVLSPYVALGASVKHVPMAIGVLNRAARWGVWSSRSWFKRTALEVGMGYMVDVQFIREGEFGSVIYYITKYMTKDQQALHIKGLRHVQTSRGIGSPKSEPALAWNVGSYISAEFFAPNTKILDLNTGFVVDNNFWETSNVYPHDGQLS